MLHCAHMPHACTLHIHTCAHVYLQSLAHVSTVCIHQRACAHIHTYMFAHHGKGREKRRTTERFKTDHTRTRQKAVGSVAARRGRAQTWQQAGPATVSAAASAATPLPRADVPHAHRPRTTPGLARGPGSHTPGWGWALLPGLQVFDAGQHV